MEVSVECRPARPVTLALWPRLLVPPPASVPAALASIAEHGGPALWEAVSGGSPSSSRSPLRLAELGSPHSPSAGSSLLVFPGLAELGQPGPRITLVPVGAVDGYAELAAADRSPRLPTLRRRRAGRRSPESPQLTRGSLPRDRAADNFWVTEVGCSQGGTGPHRGLLVGELRCHHP